jgi:hypothetical protein
MRCAAAGIMLSNVAVVANRMQFEDGHNGRLIGFEDPLLTSVRRHPFPSSRMRQQQSRYCPQVNKSVSTLLSFNDSFAASLDQANACQLRRLVAAARVTRAWRRAYCCPAAIWVLWRVRCLWAIMRMM